MSLRTGSSHIPSISPLFPEANWHFTTLTHIVEGMSLLPGARGIWNGSVLSQKLQA
ncbi:hypothetical protein L915_17738 [Phytophthora nicotianae]|uniref:Uncharacterized protein n=1 Tax=Phytophthora nicotianae TaxID=4792 RepID=W2G0F3_PHYNI|nr:hypothetical protein L915_17738 [Phytophthora nicotianae]ETL29125.1 hypothetical protein L916_17638 [Phytophthora nicotianae]